MTKQLCRTCHGLADPQDAPVKPDCLTCGDTGDDPRPYCSECHENVKWPDEGGKPCGACLIDAENRAAGRHRCACCGKSCALENDYCVPCWTDLRRGTGCSSSLLSDGTLPPGEPWR